MNADQFADFVFQKMKKQKKEQEMRKVVDASVNRTTDIRTFCGLHGISVAVFYYWRKRLGGSESVDKFVSVKVKSNKVRDIEDAKSKIELCLGSVKIRFGELPDPDYLRALLGLND